MINSKLLFFNMNPKYAKYIKRIENLIKESDEILAKKTTGYMGRDYISNKSICFAWKTKVDNILGILFDENSKQIETINNILKQGHITNVSEIESIKGLLIGVLDDIKEGFLQSYEFFITSEIFDNLLEKAEYLNEKDFKNVAAILCRIVLEDSLKRIARKKGIDDTQKASKLNDDLKKSSIYNQITWRQNQTWLDIGNAATHGNFDEYKKEDISKMINGLKSFLANELN